MIAFSSKLLFVCLFFFSSAGIEIKAESLLVTGMHGVGYKCTVSVDELNYILLTGLFFLYVLT